MTTITEIKNRAMNAAKEEAQENRASRRERSEPQPDVRNNVQKRSAIEVNEEETPKKQGRLSRLHDFDFSINKENAPRILPFIFYVSFWLILYIANRHYGEKALVRADRMRKEMKDLKADFYTSNAALSNKSIQSYVAKMVESQGLKELITPPGRIHIKQDER